MNVLKKLIASLFLTVISTSAFAISNADLFTWAAANYPGYFSGTPTVGIYEKYTYQLYSSGNYLAVDNAGTVYILGPATGNAIISVGTLTAFAPAVAAWQSVQYTGSANGIPTSPYLPNRIGSTWTYNQLCSSTGSTCQYSQRTSNVVVTGYDSLLQKAFLNTTGPGPDSTYSSTMQLDGGNSLVETKIGTATFNLDTGLYTYPSLLLPGNMDLTDQTKSWARSGAVVSSGPNKISYPEVREKFITSNVARTVGVGTFNDCIQINTYFTVTDAAGGTEVGLGTEYYSAKAGALIERTFTLNYTSPTYNFTQTMTHELVGYGTQSHMITGTPTIVPPAVFGTQASGPSGVTLSAYLGGQKTISNKPPSIIKSPAIGTLSNRVSLMWNWESAAMTTPAISVGYATITIAPYAPYNTLSVTLMAPDQVNSPGLYNLTTTDGTCILSGTPPAAGIIPTCSSKGISVGATSITFSGTPMGTGSAYTMTGTLDF